METTENNPRELSLLEQIERDPDVTQASLATQLGVAVGTVNWHLKRLVEKGYVKVKRAERKKLRYIITPEGLALRARLTVDYIERSFDLYRKIRTRVKKHLVSVKMAGFDRVRLIGKGDVAVVLPFQVGSQQRQCQRVAVPVGDHRVQRRVRAGDA